jgi:hypothetical protein
MRYGLQFSLGVSLSKVQILWFCDFSNFCLLCHSFLRAPLRMPLTLCLPPWLSMENGNDPTVIIISFTLLKYLLFFLAPHLETSRSRQHSTIGSTAGIISVT